LQAKEMEKMINRTITFIALEATIQLDFFYKAILKLDLPVYFIF
jgi:hypothetical protein